MRLGTCPVGRYALATDTGKLLWSHAFGDNVRSAAVIATDGTVFTGSDGTYVALTPSGGEVVGVLPVDGVGGLSRVT